MELGRVEKLGRRGRGGMGWGVAKLLFIYFFSVLERRDLICVLVALSSLSVSLSLPFSFPLSLPTLPPFPSPSFLRAAAEM